MHEMAEPAAHYFEAISMQDKAKAHKFYTLMFENQRKLDESFLKSSAQKVGANMAKLEKDIRSETIRKMLQEDMEEFEKFGFNGTPLDYYQWCCSEWSPTRRRTRTRC